MKRLTITASLVLAAAAALAGEVQIATGSGECLQVNGAASRGVACNAADPRQRITLRDLPPLVVTPAPSAPAPSPSAPEPAASTPTDPPKTKPAEVPASTGEIPLTQRMSTVPSGYQSIVQGPMRVINNGWGVRNVQAGSWWQSIGAGTLASDGSLDFRVAWDFSGVTKTAPNTEIISYPEVAYGVSASFGKSPGAKIPMKVGSVQSLRTSYKGLESGASRGQSHITYDLWTSNSPAALAKPNRLAEIMLPEFVIGGYGVPNSPAAATAGRAGQVATGRNPHGYQGRHTIGGDAFDVYFFPAGSPYTGLAWKFIVFEPVVFGGADGAVREWKPILEFMAVKEWINREDWLNSVELGAEPAYAGSKGDVTVRGFKVEVE